MSYDAGLVERVRDALARLGERGSRERGVFGGRGFLQGKHTFLIVYGDGIIAKMPPEGYDASLMRSGVSAFAPGGERPMSTWVVVSADTIADDPELADWVALSLQGVRSAPASKVAKAPASKVAKAPAKKMLNAPAKKATKKKSR